MAFPLESKKNKRQQGLKKGVIFQLYFCILGG